VVHLGAGGKPSKWKRPIVLLSVAIALAPVREFQLLVESAAVENTCDFFC
jgi:hypothetical protein